MSIEDEILERNARGMLFPLSPLAPGTTAKRSMFVEERLWKLLQSPEGDDEWEKRVAYLRADLEVFVTGEVIGPKYLFLLYPARDAVWEIRSVQEEPSIRVLGFFPKKDVYVAATFALREELGGWQSREWKTVKRFAAAVWRKLFPSYRPITTTKVEEVVTGALDGKYFKCRG